MIEIDWSDNQRIVEEHSTGCLTGRCWIGGVVLLFLSVLPSFTGFLTVREVRVSSVGGGIFISSPYRRPRGLSNGRSSSATPDTGAMAAIHLPLTEFFITPFYRVSRSGRPVGPFWNSLAVIWKDSVNRISSIQVSAHSLPSVLCDGSFFVDELGFPLVWLCSSEKWLSYFFLNWVLMTF